MGVKNTGKEGRKGGRKEGNSHTCSRTLLYYVLHPSYTPASCSGLPASFDVSYRPIYAPRFLQHEQGVHMCSGARECSIPPPPPPLPTPPLSSPSHSFRLTPTTIHTKQLTTAAFVMVFLPSIVCCVLRAACCCILLPGQTTSGGWHTPSQKWKQRLLRSSLALTVSNATI